MRWGYALYRMAKSVDFNSTVVCRKTRDRRDYYLLLSQKTFFFLLEHESEQAQEQTSATMLHDLKEFHRSADVRPGSAFFPIQMFARSLQLPFMRRLRRRGHRGV